MRYNKLIKIMGFIFSYIVVGFIFIFIFNNSVISKLSVRNLPNTKESTLINALKSYYGEWEIVEDFGYHGISRTIELYPFEVGKVVYFYEELFRYEDIIEFSHPQITIDITTSSNIQGLDGMTDPGMMGFDVYEPLRYAKISVKGKYGSIIHNFYILNDTEIILEGDAHRYYRAVKKN